MVSRACALLPDLYINFLCVHKSCNQMLSRALQDWAAQGQHWCWWEGQESVWQQGFVMIWICLQGRDELMRAAAGLPGCQADRPGTHTKVPRPQGNHHHPPRSPSQNYSPVIRRCCHQCHASHSVLVYNPHNKEVTFTSDSKNMQVISCLHCLTHQKAQWPTVFARLDTQRLLLCLWVHNSVMNSFTVDMIYYIDNKTAQESLVFPTWNICHNPQGIFFKKKKWSVLLKTQW